MQEAECDILEDVIDRADKIGKGYVEKNSKKLCKSIMVRFSTFSVELSFIGAKVS